MGFLFLSSPQFSLFTFFLTHFTSPHFEFECTLQNRQYSAQGVCKNDANGISDVIIPLLLHSQDFPSQQL